MTADFLFVDSKDSLEPKEGERKLNTRIRSHAAKFALRNRVKGPLTFIHSKQSKAAIGDEADAEQRQLPARTPWRTSTNKWRAYRNVKPKPITSRPPKHSPNVDGKNPDPELPSLLSPATKAIFHQIPDDLRTSVQFSKLATTRTQHPNPLATDFEQSAQGILPGPAQPSLSIQRRRTRSNYRPLHPGERNGLFRNALDGICPDRFPAARVFSDNKPTRCVRSCHDSSVEEGFGSRRRTSEAPDLSHLHSDMLACTFPIFTLQTCSLILRL
jgi:hypothetical protein